MTNPLQEAIHSGGENEHRYDLEVKSGSSWKYGKWLIYYDPPPIPTRNCDYHFTHDDYDGEGDPRHGHAASVADAVSEINCIEDEED